MLVEPREEAAAAAAAAVGADSELPGSGPEVRKVWFAWNEVSGELSQDGRGRGVAPGHLTDRCWPASPRVPVRVLARALVARTSNPRPEKPAEEETVAGAGVAAEAAQAGEPAVEQG